MNKDKSSPEFQVDMLLARMVLNQVVIPPGADRCEVCDGGGILWPLDPHEPDEFCEFCNGTGVTTSKENGDE